VPAKTVESLEVFQFLENLLKAPVDGAQRFIG